jgi:hypothetical protein
VLCVPDEVALILCDESPVVPPLLLRRLSRDESDASLSELSPRRRDDLALLVLVFVQYRAT